MEEIASLIEHDADDERLAKYILELLQRHYPNHTWVVQVFGKDGYATIRNPSLSYKYGMRIIFPRAAKNRLIIPGGALSKMGELEYKVIHSGGEFLERMGVPRKKAEAGQVEELFQRGRFA